MEGRSMVALAQQLPRRIRRVVAVATMLHEDFVFIWRARRGVRVRLGVLRAHGICGQGAVPAFDPRPEIVAPVFR